MWDSHENGNSHSPPDKDTAVGMISKPSLGDFDDFLDAKTCQPPVPPPLPTLTKVKRKKIKTPSPINKTASPEKRHDTDSDAHAGNSK
jgi:hypothetical protein